MGKLAPGASTTNTSYFRKSGSTSFFADEKNIITYREYTGGRVTELIEDADQRVLHDIFRRGAVAQDAVSEAEGATGHRLV